MQTKEAINLTELWCTRLGIGTRLVWHGLEQTGDPLPTAADRLDVAHDAMREAAKTQFPGDNDLADIVARIAASSLEAVDRLTARGEGLSRDHCLALEAVVAFDGTRPSFLVRDGYVDLESSLSTSQWKTTLSPSLSAIAGAAACVGRVEIGEQHLGTAFLVAPTLAITNRHVVEAFATFHEGGSKIIRRAFLDFGREHRGRDSYDRREITTVIFTGPSPITSPIDHRKLDLALIEVSPSQLGGERADRAFKLDAETRLSLDELVMAIGYPGDWRWSAPDLVQSRYAAALAKLLDGGGGAKRVAPGAWRGSLANEDGPKWTGCHDATTVAGNSGSPLLLLSNPGRSVALHYAGRWVGPSTNWAHLFSECLEAPGATGQCLRAALRAHGVPLEQN